MEVGGREILPPTSFSVADGGSVAIVGPSGSGKSTLLECLTGWRAVSGGQVVIDGAEPLGKDAASRDAYRRNEVGVLFQEHDLLPELTVGENVALLETFRGGPAGIERRVADHLDLVGLAGRQGSAVTTLSGGEAQRVAVARALLSAKSLLVADEPTAALDRANADNVSALLIDLSRRRGIPLVLATHDRRVAERCDEVVDLGVTR